MTPRTEAPPPLPGLRLRPMAADDLDALVDLDSDPEVTRYINGGQATPREVYVEHILPRILAHADAARGRGYFAIVDDDAAAGERFLGWAHLRPDHLEPTWLELGYRLHRRVWGRGVATWAGATLVRRGLADASVPVISARTDVDNRASRRVMEKLGMRLAGEFEFPAATIGTLAIPAAQAVLYVLKRGAGG
ncbi:MAG: GNAT family N-acetyltransferase [Myxococcales bacterium]|nr:GNAT family N-acetyltransferase [Myxococcales bacterium]